MESLKLIRLIALFHYLLIEKSIKLISFQAYSLAAEFEIIN